MGKTRTAVVSGVPEEPEKKKKLKKKHKKSLRKEKGVRIPGLKGGERIVAVDVELPPEEKEEKPDTEKVPEGQKRESKPRVRGKKYIAALAKVDKSKLYPLEDAVKLVKETSYSKFDGTVELHAVVKKEGLSINIELPYSTGKKKKVEIADSQTLKKLKKRKIDFDVLLATAEMMPKLVPFAKLLGTRGLMPNPKTGTLIKDLPSRKASARQVKEDIIRKFSGNSATIKTERKAPIIHTIVGKVAQNDKELVKNTQAIIDAITKRQIVKAILTSTMGPGIKLDIS